MNRLARSNCWEYNRSYTGWNKQGRSDLKVNGERVYFTYNTKTHKYGISYGPKEDIMIMSKAKAEAVIAFLEWINK